MLIDAARLLVAENEDDDPSARILAKWGSKRVTTEQLYDNLVRLLYAAGNAARELTSEPHTAERRAGAWSLVRHETSCVKP